MFRPDYWAPPSDPITAITRNVKGQLRRHMIADIVSGRAADRAPNETARQLLSEVHTDLLSDELEDPNMLGPLHPWWMGGEYLPPYLPGEIEIARIVLQSTTMDVSSVRARPADGQIQYRVVDEYPDIGPFVLLEPTVSERPLTFGEIVTLIDSIKPNPNAFGHVREWLKSQSGRPDSNRGPPAPKAGALPNCATPRYFGRRLAVDG